MIRKVPILCGVILLKQVWVGLRQEADTDFRVKQRHRSIEPTSELREQKGKREREREIGRRKGKS